VLGFLVAEALVPAYPEYREGELSRLKPPGERGPSPCVARRLDLVAIWNWARSEEDERRPRQKDPAVDTRSRHSGMWLTATGAVQEFLRRARAGRPVFGDEEAGTDIQPAIREFQSALQELAQATKLPQPRYTVMREPARSTPKRFTVEVRVGKDFTGQADRPHQENRRAEGGRGVYERLRQRGVPDSPPADPTREPA